MKFGANNKKIDSIKLINFGHTMTLDSSDLLTISEQVDHCPPEHLLKIADALKKQQEAESKNMGESTEPLEHHVEIQ